MSGAKDALTRITMDLSSTGVQFALIGDLAVSVRTEPRFTQDVDLAIAVPDDAVAEQTVKVLIDRNYRMLATVEHETAGRLATARLRLPDPSRSSTSCSRRRASNPRSWQPQTRSPWPPG